jgi:hypothetical protein
MDHFIQIEALPISILTTSIIRNPLAGFHLGFSSRGGANATIVELRGGEDTLVFFHQRSAR